MKYCYKPKIINRSHVENKSMGPCVFSAKLMFSNKDWVWVLGVFFGHLQVEFGHCKEEKKKHKNRSYFFHD